MGFQTPITIDQAMQNIDNKGYLLPAFQRDFVWKAEQIEMLFDSVMREYPISSFLFWKVKGDTKTKWKFYNFIDHFIAGAKDKSVENKLCNTNNLNDFYAILDGQQRLTALRIGLYGTYSFHENRKSWNYSENSFPTRRLYLNISKTGGVDDEFKYKFEFKKDSVTGAAVIYVDDNDEKWLKVSEVVALYHSGDDTGDYFADGGFELSKEEKHIINRLKLVIFNKPLVMYYEEEEQNPDKAVDIFTRINSGGTFLSFSDIVFSLMVAHWSTRDAKQEMKDLLSGVSDKGFEISVDYVVKAILYLHHKNVKTEINSFTNDFCALIENNWGKISASILSLFDLLRSYGLNSSSLTSNNATLPILYYMYHKDISDGFTDRIGYKEDRENIKTWLLAVLLRKVFGGSSDGTLQQIRKAFTDDFENSFIDASKSFEEFNINSYIKGIGSIDDEMLNEILDTQKDDRYAFAILSLLYPHLDYKNNDFHKDHIHADVLYDALSDDLKAKYPFKAYNSIVNLQMLDKNENESKGKMPLDKWVEKMCSSTDTKQRFLAAHLIPDVDLSLSNFDEYYKERAKLLKTKLKELLDI